MELESEAKEHRWAKAKTRSETKIFIRSQTSGSRKAGYTETLSVDKSVVRMRHPRQKPRITLCLGV